jgi:O-antigen/teichoic acid export membrane protein
MSRFLFLFVIAKELSPAVVGSITYLLAWLPGLVVIVSMEAFLPMQKSISNQTGNYTQIGDQVILSVLTTAIASIIILTCFIDSISNETRWIFILLLYTEFILNEIGRYYIYDNKTIPANLIYFARQGLTSILAVLFVLADIANSTGGLILIFLTANLVYLIIIKLFGDSSFLKYINKGDPKRSLSILKESIPYAISSFSITTFEKSDKIIVTTILGPSISASYNILSNIMFSLSQFVYAGVLSVKHRKLLDEAVQADLKNFRAIAKETTLQIVLIAITLGIPLIVFNIGLVHFGKLEFNLTKAFIQSSLLLAGIILLNCSRCPNYILIAKGMEWRISGINLLCILIYVISLSTVMTVTYKNMAATLFTFSAAFLYLIKFYNAKKYY